MENILNINAISDYLAIRKQEVLHPFVGLVDFNKVMEEAKSIKNYTGLRFSCYAIFLKDAKGCKIKYGGKSYDYDEGTLVFVGPDQVVKLTYNEPKILPKGYALLFHPDLFLGTDMKKRIQDYSFFSYSSKEALHLSGKERRIIVSLLEKIQVELDQTLDKHSKKIIINNIELILDYCMRFYDRQFITRETANLSVIKRFVSSLSAYVTAGLAFELGTPSVSYFAEQQNLSPNYFGDLIKKETGISAHEHIQIMLIKTAKEKMIDSDKSLSEIAYELGFKHPQHFSRLFKNKTGYTPKEFRSLN